MNAKSIIGLTVVGFIVFYVGVTFVFGPVSAGDTPAAAMNPMVSLGVVSLVSAFIFLWVNGAVGNAVRSGMIIAVSQIALVDIYYPLSGRRGWMGALASAAVLLIGWWVIATVYDKALAGGGSSDD